MRMSIVPCVPHPLEHSPAGRALDTAEATEIAEGMRAFGAESRVRILFALYDEEHTVEELAAATESEANAVSQQLRVLRQLRYVAAAREGRHVRYRLYDHHVRELLASIRHHHEHARNLWPSPAADTGTARVE